MMNTFTHYLISKNSSKATVEMNERAVYDFCNWCEDQRIDAREATYTELLSYMKHLQARGLKQRTIQMLMGSLKHYFKWLIVLGVRETEPTEGIIIKGVQRRTLYHIIPMAELEKVYEQFKENEVYLSGDYQIWHRSSHYAQKLNKVMFGLMIWQGLGASELENLKLQDLKLREGKIYIAGDRRSNERILKLEAVQILDLMDYLQDTRQEYLRINPSATDQLFVKRRGSDRIGNHLLAVLQSVKALNSQLTKAQQIRASVITHWLKNHNLREVQYRAGHRYVSSTEAYLINDLDDLKEDITKFHPMG